MMVAGTGLELGFPAAARLAFVPLVSDAPLHIVTALVLETLPGVLLSVLSAFGGAVVLFIGVRFLRLPRGRPVGETPALPPSATQAASFWHAATGTLLPPMPRPVQLVIGSALPIRSWAGIAAKGLLFVGLLSGVNISAATALGCVASRTRWVIATFMISAHPRRAETWKRRYF